LNQSISEKATWSKSSALVIALVGKVASDSWWHSPNKAFEMLSVVFGTRK